MCYRKELISMAYFLKKTKRNDRIYLSIYESFYSPETKNTKHKSFKKIGFVDNLISQGIPDPVSHFQKEVDELNLAYKFNKIRRSSMQISDVSPKRYLGYVPLCRVLNILDIEEHYQYMASNRKFKFDLYEMFCALVYARTVAPCSKWKTYNDIFPKMVPNYDFSYYQVLEALQFMGNEYERLVEILTVATNDNFGIDTSHAYFDCTNFYFEIDKESFLQKKGPSKENKKDPIVGMGLLLDNNLLPIGFEMYPGNQSEKPVLRHVIDNLKTRSNIKGRTVQIADKGLNCAANIIEAVNNNDGYLFSKSVKKLPSKEKDWILSDNDYKTINDDHGNPSFKIKSCIDEFEYSYIDPNGNKATKKVKEKRVVSYNYKLARKKQIEIERLIRKAKRLSASQAKKDEYGECSRYVSFVDGNGKKANTIVNQEAIDKDLAVAGYNMLVTSEINVSAMDVYKTYHQLWRIEESFRILKSDLDARPVYLQSEDEIKGHFFICYACVLLERILQFKILKNKYSTSCIYKFFREFEVTKINGRQYINNLTRSDFVLDLAEILHYPLTNFYLSESQIKMMHTR